MSYRPMFIEALRQIERAGRLAVVKGGRLSVVIVGGSAVELSTAGAVTSGDIIEIDLNELSRQIEERKAAIGGLSSERIERARNKGLSRTPEKRALLARLDALAAAAGRDPSFIRNY